MNQNIKFEFVVATFFVLLLNKWEFLEIETLLVEVAVLILLSKHLLEIVGGGRKPPTFFVVVQKN